MIRQMYDEQARAGPGGDVQKQFENDMESTMEFLRAGRLHGVGCTGTQGRADLLMTKIDPQELLIRYNPLHDMSPEERVHATARRVGLESPEKYSKQENE